ncbi:MAG TPA: hypothetical protein VKX46_07400, partial [Ktedonobacteraceae bacterium]|nr:hypothetical protein [Ktedonobacteraceae bacterium]
QREMTSSAIFTRAHGQNGSETDQMSSLDRKRVELELGQGGDHDVPYRFAGANEFPQVLAWVLLLARIHRGEVQP